VKGAVAVFAYASAASVVSFAMINALIMSGIDGAYRRICTDGDVGGGLILFLGLALIGTVPVSVCVGCVIASVRPRLTLKRIICGSGAALASIGVVFVVSYATAVLSHAETRSCETNWSLIVPSEKDRAAA
jgi:hypothetical protein